MTQRCEPRTAPPVPPRPPPQGPVPPLAALRGSTPSSPQGSTLLLSSTDLPGSSPTFPAPPSAASWGRAPPLLQGRAGQGRGRRRARGRGRALGGADDSRKRPGRRRREAEARSPPSRPELRMRWFAEGACACARRRRGGFDARVGGAPPQRVGRRGSESGVLLGALLCVCADFWSFTPQMFNKILILR